MKLSVKNIRQEGSGPAREVPKGTLFSGWRVVEHTDTGWFPWPGIYNNREAAERLMESSLEGERVMTGIKDAEMDLSSARNDVNSARNDLKGAKRILDLREKALRKCVGELRFERKREAGPKLALALERLLRAYSKMERESACGSSPRSTYEARSLLKRATDEACELLNSLKKESDS